MTVDVPEAPVGFTAAQVGSVFNVKTDAEQQRVFDLAVVTVNRALAGAFRSVDQQVYDDLVRRVAGAIANDKRRPMPAGGGQLTTVEQAAPNLPGRGDYLAPVRGTLAQYVVPL